MSIQETIRKADEISSWTPLEKIGKLGIRSSHAYIAGFVSVGLSFASWLMSRKKKDSRDQSDRWGLFIGEWAPTFFALGVGLKLEEKKSSRH